MFPALNNPSLINIGSHVSHFSRCRSAAAGLIVISFCTCWKVENLTYGSTKILKFNLTWKYDTTRSATVATYNEFVIKSITFHISWTYSCRPTSHSCFTSLQIKPRQRKKNCWLSHSWLLPFISCGCKYLLFCIGSKETVKTQMLALLPNNKISRLCLLAITFAVNRNPITKKHKKIDLFLLLIPGWWYCYGAELP